VTDEGPRNPYAYAGCEDPTLEGPDDFVFAITSGDDRVISFCLYEARKRKILVPLFERLIKQTPPSTQTREAFHRAWIEQGLYIREDFAVDPLLPDVLRNFLPGYSGAPVELFRGERGSNHEAGAYGVSWTPKRDIARMFARGLNRCPQTGSVVVHAVAPACAILAAPRPDAAGIKLEESEYVVDRRALGVIDVLERYPPGD
jgi:hypothetical protein